MKPSTGSGRRVAQPGQGLIEALAGIAVLAVLMLLLVALGKYQAVDLAAVQGARTLAFDCAVIPARCAGAAPDAAWVNRLRARYTGGPGPQYHHAGLWTTRRGQPLLDRPEDVAVTLEHPVFNAGLGIAGSATAPRLSGGVRFLSDEAGPGRFGLAITGGMMRPRVQIGLLAARGAGTPAQILDGMPLRPHARLAILGDAWNASGPQGGTQSVHARVDQGWRLGRGIEEAFDVAHAGTKLAIRMMNELFLEDLTTPFQRETVDVDIVPADRLPESGDARQ